jgi:predicted ATPase
VFSVLFHKPDGTSQHHHHITVIMSSGKTLSSSTLPGIPKHINTSHQGISTVDDGLSSVSDVSKSINGSKRQGLKSERTTGASQRLQDSGGNLTSSFHFSSNDLIGRDSEQALLLQAYLRVSNKSKSEVILISGASGSGKSSLARRLQPQLCPSSSYFLEGKFDQLMRSDLYSALTMALSQLVELVLYSGKLEVVKEAVEASFKGDQEGLIILTSLIPNLYQITGIFHAGGAAETICNRAFGKLKCRLCKFLQTVLDASLPVVLFLDDIQWASWESIELIESLTKNESVKGLLLIMTCRSSSRLCNLFGYASDESENMKDKSLEFESHQITKIELTAISLEEVDGMIRSIIGVEDDTLPLSRIVHSKTEGNPFHAIKFLEMLETEGFLVAKKKWKLIMGRTSYPI